jgi:hypothetical protein
MKKKLNVAGMMNELAGGKSAFFRGVEPQQNIQSDEILPVRTDVRPYDRTVNSSKIEANKRETKRHPFEIYRDQLQELQAIKAHALVDGQNMSLSHMVREAIDMYLKARK